MSKVLSAASTSSREDSLPSTPYLPVPKTTLLPQAKDCNATQKAMTPANFVTKGNEPGDLGIQGVALSADGSRQIPLTQFRSKVKRAVFRLPNSKSHWQPYATITPGKGVSITALKADQEVLEKISCYTAKS